MIDRNEIRQGVESLAWLQYDKDRTRICTDCFVGIADRLSGEPSTIAFTLLTVAASLGEQAEGRDETALMLEGLARALAPDLQANATERPLEVDSDIASTFGVAASTLKAPLIIIATGALIAAVTLLQASVGPGQTRLALERLLEFERAQ